MKSEKEVFDARSTVLWSEAFERVQHFFWRTWNGDIGTDFESLVVT